MKLAIMFPYFLPYIGYWQLMKYVDKFVIYDNAEFEKAGWIRRNYILINGQKKMFTVPIKKASDYLNIDQRELTENSDSEMRKILRQIEQNYRRAPFFKETFPLIESIFLYDNRNLFYFVYHSIRQIAEYLSIETPIIVSSAIEMDHCLRKRDKVIEICRKLEADSYINTVGGMTLYDKADFKRNGITLDFFQSELPVYRQYQYEFIPYLSIIDVMMFNSRDKIITEMLSAYTLL